MIYDLRHWAQRHPEQIAVQIGDTVLTYAELEFQANQLARLFDALGLKRGDHVAASLTNSPFTLVMAWAAWRSGLYYTPIATTLALPDAAAIITNCRARLVVADRSVQTHVAKLPAHCAAVAHWFWHGDAVPGFRSLSEDMADQSELPRVGEAPGALMLYTSGTTGAPKGVWRPLPPADQRATPTFAADLIPLFGFDHGVRYLSTAPLYHAAPLRAALAVTAAGGCVIGMRKFDAAEALQLLATQHITHSQWVPAMFQRLLQLPESARRDFRSPLHRVALHAAAPCPPQVKRAMIDWWGPILVEYYSGSEGVGLTMISTQEWLTHPSSVGRTVKGVPHVLDEEFRELAPGCTGRIYFSGVTPFEYFGDPNKTADRTSPQGYQTLGDIGYLDAEGYLYLTDRMDDVIISGGVNIYPQEIEAALLEMVGVADVGVIGTEDEKFGERPVAFVVAVAGDDEHALRRDLPAWCEARLGRIKAPARFEFVHQLPRSPTGKLIRRELRERLYQHQPPGAN
ncbi:AMP-binding protein [Trinickia sp. EG282A]|uniref:AMP-binding protein n=1 Tax=Trinickia sp. EG282A TaxID=3237013 RepID=UPI0034D35FBD